MVRRLIRWNSLVPVLLILSLSVSAEAHPSLPPEASRLVGDAFLSLQSGDFQEASVGFRRMAQHVPLLADYADYFLAESLDRIGKVDIARGILGEFPSKHPDSRLIPLALLLDGYLAERNGNEAEAEVLYRRWIDRFPLHPDLPRARYLLGLTLAAQGRGLEAARLFQALWLEAPATAYGEAA